MNVYL